MDVSLDRALLIESFKQDPKLAISTIYKETIEKIYRYVYFRVYDEADAEDITEEVYLKLIKQMNNYDGNEGISSWLYQIARTEIANFWRERYKVNGRIIKVDEGFLDELFIMQEPESIDNKLAEQKTNEILAKLPGNYAQVLRLRFLAGYTLEECAKKMNITLDNVKVLQHRAIKKAGGDL